jgi:heterodisulfide reductase subunit B
VPEDAMKIPYYPGCTLHERAKDFDTSARECARALGVELEELPIWTCCGAVYPLVTDSVMDILAGVRNLAYAAREGDKLVTLCSFCYNVLKRSNRVMREDAEKREKANLFLRADTEAREKIESYTHEDYEGQVEVLHYLEMLRDVVGYDKIAGAVKKKLEGLKVAPYYGCMLLRPAKEMEFDDPEQPEIFEGFLEALGCDVVDFPMKAECCGGFQVVGDEDLAVSCSQNVVTSALKRDADMIVTTCPLCRYNLDRHQERMSENVKGFRKVPVVYFTQLLGVALGLDKEHLDFSDNTVDPVPVLAQRSLF